MFKGIDVNCLAFLDDFKALIIRGRDSLMFIDLRSSKKQMIRSVGINGMEISGSLYGPNSQV